MNIGQNDRESLQRFKDAVGVGYLYGPYTQKGRKNPISEFRVNKVTDVHGVLLQLWPFLGSVKKEQAKAAFVKYGRNG